MSIMQDCITRNGYHCRRIGFYPLSVRSVSQHVIKLINLAKYLKGSTTLTELDEMPVYMIHTIYKEYVNFLQDQEKQDQHASEEVMDELEDQLT